MYKKRKLRKSDIFEELKEKRQNPIIPIIIFLSIVIILFLAIYWGYNLIKDNTDLKIPWINKETKEKEKPKVSSKDDMELILPKLPEELNTHNIEGAQIRFTDITKDSNGYVVTVSVLAEKIDYITVEFTSITIDGFYISSRFAISDRMDYESEGYLSSVQEPTYSEFRIKQTELDNLGIFGFNELKIYYNYETPNSSAENVSMYLIGQNELNIVNERKGLIQFDTKDDMTISYYKTIDAEDATYIYFDFKNQSRTKDYIIKINKLEINGKPYDLKNFEKKIYKDCEDELYLKIPKKDISKVNTLNVSFFVLSENNKSQLDYVYITNEYTKTF